MESCQRVKSRGGREIRGESYNEKLRKAEVHATAPGSRILESLTGCRPGSGHGNWEPDKPHHAGLPCPWALDLPDSCQPHPPRTTTLLPFAHSPTHPTRRDSKRHRSYRGVGGTEYLHQHRSSHGWNSGNAAVKLRVFRHPGQARDLRFFTSSLRAYHDNQTVIYHLGRRFVVVQQRQDLHTAPTFAADNPTAACWVSVLPAEQFPNLRPRLGAMRETPPIRRLRPPVSHRPEMAAGNRHQTLLLYILLRTYYCCYYLPTYPELPHSRIHTYTGAPKVTEYMHSSTLTCQQKARHYVVCMRSPSYPSLHAKIHCQVTVHSAVPYPTDPPNPSSISHRRLVA
jgi:hypothetical protein